MALLAQWPQEDGHSGEVLTRPVLGGLANRLDAKLNESFAEVAAGGNMGLSCFRITTNKKRKPAIVGVPLFRDKPNIYHGIIARGEYN